VGEALGRISIVTERLTLSFSTLLLAAIALLPIAAMLSETVTADGAFSLRAYHVLLTSEGKLIPLMSRSLQLALLTASIATLIGVPLGILLGKTDLPLRGSLTLLLTAPLLIPPMFWQLPGSRSWVAPEYSAACCLMHGRKQSPQCFLDSGVAPSCLHARSCRSPCF
jgi:ABC-type tungstate transport system substrate-binding protein